MIDWFACDKFEQPASIHLIRERYLAYETRCNIWFVKGESADLLVDTGLGLASLWNYLIDSRLIALRNANGDVPLLEKTLYVVLTHIHFDHSGGAFEFSRDINENLPRNVILLAHIDESRPLITGNPMFTLNHLKRSDLMNDPPAFWHPMQLKVFGNRTFEATGNYRVLPAVPVDTLENGDIIDLGNKIFNVIHIPGHSPGSIGLFCEGSGELFSGDAFYDGQLLDFLPGSNISQYKSSAERMIELCSTSQVIIVYPGHFHLFGGARLRSIAEEYLAGNRIGRYLKNSLKCLITCYFSTRNCRCYICNRNRNKNNALSVQSE